MRGRLAGLMSLVLVSATAAIVGAPSAYAAPFSDDFNRVDGTSLGDSWSEVIGTDLEIAANALTNPQNTSTFALALFATGNRVTAKVGSTGQGGASVALVLAHLTLNDAVSVKAYDSDGNASLDRISVSREINGAAVADVPVTAFGGGVMQVTLVGSRLKVTVADQGAPSPFISERFTLPDAPSGTGVGLGITKTATIDDFASTVFVPSNPAITAQTTSDVPATSFGWYRGTVFVDYVCTEDGSPLLEPCPTGDNIAEEGANRTRSHTITADDGGSDTVTVSVDIDLTAPAVTLAGITAAPYLEDPRRTARCVGSDALSGIASCVVNAFELGGGKVRVEALATDKAGLQAVDEAVVRMTTSGILRATYRRGAYEVERGKKYTVVVLGSKKIFLVGVGDVTRKPKAFTSKNGRWELRFKIPAGTPLGKTSLLLRKGKGATFRLPIAVRR